MEHIGSAGDAAELELLLAVARQRINAGQDELDLGPAAADQSALEVTSTRMGRLLDALAAAYRQMGFDTLTGGDAVFEQLVTARIIEPTSKLDASRVLEEAGVLAGPAHLSPQTRLHRGPSCRRVRCPGGV